MMTKKWIVCLALPVLWGSLTSSGLAAEVPEQNVENLVDNGSFEKGVNRWGYKQWKGLPVPGRVSEEQPFQGKKCFVLTEPGTVEQRFIRTSIFKVDPQKDYTINLALALIDIPKNNVKVRVLQYGKPQGKKSPVLGWAAPKRKGVHDLIPNLHGTTDWKRYSVQLPANSLNQKVDKIAIYFLHENPSLGELKIDAVSCTQDQPTP